MNEWQILSYDKNGNWEYCIDPQDPVWGWSVWKRRHDGSQRVLAKDLPAKVRKAYEAVTKQMKGE